MREYDLIADWYARDRVHLTGVPEVQALATTLPRGAAVLDVGCGNGIPLTKLLVDAAISWGVIFHLPHSDQTLAFAKVAQALKPGGRFLFTSGDAGDKDDNGIEGAPMNGVPFRYWSLTAEGYRELLCQHGLRLIDTHQDSGKNTYYLAEKFLKDAHKSAMGLR